MGEVTDFKLAISFGPQYCANTRYPHQKRWDMCIPPTRSLRCEPLLQRRYYEHCRRCQVRSSEEKKNDTLDLHYHTGSSIFPSHHYGLPRDRFDTEGLHLICW